MYGMRIFCRISQFHNNLLLFTGTDGICIIDIDKQTIENTYKELGI